MQSLDVGTFRSAIPLAFLMENVLNRLVSIVGREDNAGVFLAVQRGYSRMLAYMAKHHRVSISALHECYFGDPDEVGEFKQHESNVLIKESTHVQRADIYTKPLAPPKHWAMVEMLKMQFLEDLIAEGAVQGERDSGAQGPLVELFKQTAAAAAVM